MSHSTSSGAQANHSLLLPFASAFGIVMFFFFIDEGYYDFRWMADIGNWIVFVGYMAVMFAVQWIISHLLLGKIKGKAKAWIMLGVVMPATIFLFLWWMS